MGLTQRELADAVGLSTVQLSRYESGKSTPRPPILAGLAKALAVSRAWLEHGDVAPGDPIDNKNTVTISFSQEEFKSLEAVAKKLGLSVEATMGRLLREELSRKTPNQLCNTPVHPTDPSEVSRGIEDALAQLRRSIEQVQAEQEVIKRSIPKMPSTPR